MADERFRTTVKIAAYHKKRLRIWAFLEGKGETTLAGDIIQDRVKANKEMIDLMLNSRAEELGISPGQLIDKIINNEEDD